MAMIYANCLLDLHPAGARVYDRHGRELHYVFACNPLTGEAILWRPLEGLTAWMDVKMFQLRRLFNLKPFPVESRLRHGFWPAPLKITLKSQESSDPG